MGSRRMAGWVGVLLALGAILVASACAPTPGTVPIAKNGFIEYEVRDDGVLVASGSGPAGVDVPYQLSTWVDGDDSLRRTANYMNTYEPFTGLPGRYRVDHLYRDHGCLFCGTAIEQATVYAPDGSTFVIDDPVTTNPSDIGDQCASGPLVEGHLAGPVVGDPSVEVDFHWVQCD